VCQADRTCGAGFSECVGDDPADAGASDDGPRGGRDLSGAEGVAVTLSGAICNTPQAEYDWYQVTVGDGDGLALALAWRGAADVDLVVFDDQQQALGLGSWRNPEAIDLAFLPAGTYFLRVALYVLTPEMQFTTDAVAYTITATRSVPPAGCVDAATHASQVYRGACDVGTGACEFIPAGAGAVGDACDSPDDCANETCSYWAFEGDAETSACSIACSSNADCATVPGTVCQPTGVCAAPCATDLDCGVDTLSPTLTPGQPWDYATCTPATGLCAF
jgi:hypothetical protein